MGTASRIEARELRARYSRAQDAARRRAAEDLRASRVGNQPWWERMTAGFANLGAMAASYVEVRAMALYFYKIEEAYRHLKLYCFLQLLFLERSFSLFLA